MKDFYSSAGVDADKLFGQIFAGFVDEKDKKGHAKYYIPHREA